MSISVDVSTPLAPRTGKRKLPEIAFIGSRNSFSDSLVRATGKELRDLALIHVPSLQAFNDLAPEQTRWLRLVLVDDATMRHASPEAMGGFACPPGASVVLAFLDYGVAGSIYGTLDKTLPIDSYVPLNVRLDVWLSILKLLLHGGRYVPPELISARPNGRSRHDGKRGRCAESMGLTPRQYSVLELVAEGLPNKVIASRLGLSDHTVKLHIHNIISKLDVTNRTEAAARFHDDLS